VTDVTAMLRIFSTPHHVKRFITRYSTFSILLGHCKNYATLKSVAKASNLPLNMPKVFAMQR